jgi:hypothetical protein
LNAKKNGDGQAGEMVSAVSSGEAGHRTATRPRRNAQEGVVSENGI